MYGDKGDDVRSRKRWEGRQSERLVPSRRRGSSRTEGVIVVHVLLTKRLLIQGRSNEVADLFEAVCERSTNT